MDVAKPAIAGTLESSDILVEVSPRESGIDLDLSSIVINQYGDAIRDVIMDTLSTLGVANAQVKVTDRGALDCVIRARVETAVLRAGKERA